MTEPDDEPIVLLYDLPPNSLFGIDLISLGPSPKFHGFKTVPHGWHFIYTGASNELSIRHGSWINLDSSAPSRPVVVRQWNQVHEQLIDRPTDQSFDSKLNIIKELWKEGLISYAEISALSHSKRTGRSDGGDEDFPRLTSFLSKQLLQRITGSKSSDDLSLTSASCFEEDKEAIPGISDDQFDQPELYFIPIDLRASWRPGAVGRERTLAAQDRSYLLSQIIQKHCSNERGLELLGEFQFAFLMILTLNNYSCMQQWKRIFRLMLSCKQAVVTRHLLFAEFLILLKLQLQHSEDVDGGLFDLSVEGSGLLRDAIMTFKRAFEQDDQKQPEDVRDALDDLLSYVKEELGWETDDNYARRGYLELEDGERVDMEVTELEEEDERGEYAPVVVDASDTIPSDQHIPP